MNLNLHQHARTTPGIRQELRESTKSERELPREYRLERGGGSKLMQSCRRQATRVAHVMIIWNNVPL